MSWHLRAIAFVLALLVTVGIDARLGSGAIMGVARAQATSATDARPIAFRSFEEEARFRALVSELRCVMCQNQSLADSDAMIAHDLRLQVLRMMRAGKSDVQIKAFLVARYSEFVLYRPTVEPRNWLLWFGPGILLLLGAVAVWLVVRNKSRQAAETALVPAPDDRESW